MEKANKKEYITGEDVKKGEKYFFVDTYFEYVNVPQLIIKKRTVYRKIGDDYSTKEDGDKYEIERHIAFETREQAVKFAIEKLKEYNRYINKRVVKAIKTVQK